MSRTHHRQLSLVIVWCRRYKWTLLLVSLMVSTITSQHRQRSMFVLSSELNETTTTTTDTIILDNEDNDNDDIEEDILDIDDFIHNDDDIEESIILSSSISNQENNNEVDKNDDDDDDNNNSINEQAMNDTDSIDDLISHNKTNDNNSTTSDNATEPNDTASTSSYPKQQQQQQQQHQQQYNPSNISSIQSSDIDVQSYLESLSDTELIDICTQRGYDITTTTTTSEDDISNNNTTNAPIKLSHSDYVQAAMQCISIDDEINTMIHNNPDIAVELEIEIERMRIEKERLINERNSMLNEINYLEQQLLQQQSDIDPTTLPNYTSINNIKKSIQSNDKLSIATNTNTNTINPNTTIDEVLYESFVLLYDRVGKDIHLIINISIQYIIKPFIQSISLIWKYTSPTIIPILQPILVYIQPIITILQSNLNKIYKFILLQYNNHYNIINQIQTIIQSNIQTFVQQYQPYIIQMYQSKEIQSMIRIMNAVILPLYHSLYNGYQYYYIQHIQPQINKIVSKLHQWIITEQE